MKKIQQLIPLVGILLLSFGCGNSPAEGGDNDQADAEAVTEEVAAPESKYDVPFPVYESYDDMKYIFDQQNDSTYIINFWATWCKPCVKELPYFEQLHEEIEGKKARIILVSMDFPNQIETRLKDFVNERNLQPDVMVLTDPDQNGWIPQVEQKWDGAIPVTVIYNASTRKFFTGELDTYEMLAGTVSEMML